MAPRRIGGEGDEGTAGRGNSGILTGGTSVAMPLNSSELRAPSAPEGVDSFHSPFFGGIGGGDSCSC